MGKIDYSDVDIEVIVKGGPKSGKTFVGMGLFALLEKRGDCVAFVDLPEEGNRPHAKHNQVWESAKPRNVLIRVEQANLQKETDDGT